MPVYRHKLEGIAATCNAADQVCSCRSEAVACGVIQESRKRGRDGDGFRDTAVSSKRARLEATDAPGPGTHVSTGDKEEEEQSKQALVTDRLLSFKVNSSCCEIGMLPILLMLAVTMNCWSGFLDIAIQPCYQTKQMRAATQ